MRMVLVGILMTLAVAPAVRAQGTSDAREVSTLPQVTFDNVNYTIPDGWTQVPGNDTYVRFEPTQLNAAEQLTLVLLPTTPASAAQVDALSQTWDEILTQLDLRAEMDAGNRFEALPPIRTTDGRVLVQADGRCRAADGTLLDLRVYLLLDGPVYLRVFVLGNVLPNSVAYPPTSALHNPRFAYQLAEFTLNLSTGGSRDLPAPPAVSLSGLWRGLSMFGGDIKDGYAYFYPDGRVYLASSMPPNGFSGLPVDADAVLRPASWGRYSFDGAQGEILLAYQSDSVFPFSRVSADHLTIVTNGAPHQFSSQPAVDGWLFNGSYALDLLTGENLTLSLSSGGQFSDRGVLKHVDHWVYPFRASDQPGDGTYAITDFTILFRYTDGRTLSLPFSGLGITAGDRSPDNVAIGTEDDLLTLR